MYSTKISEPAETDEITDGYGRSNKNGAARHILCHYGRQHTRGITFPTIDALFKDECVIVVEDGGKEMLTGSSRSTPRQVLKDRMKNATTLTELCTALDIHYSNMIVQIPCFIRQAAADDRWLPACPAQLG